MARGVRCRGEYVDMMCMQDAMNEDADADADAKCRKNVEMVTKMLMLDDGEAKEKGDEDEEVRKVTCIQL